MYKYASRRTRRSLVRLNDLCVLRAPIRAQTNHDYGKMLNTATMRNLFGRNTQVTPGTRGAGVNRTPHPPHVEQGLINWPQASTAKSDKRRKVLPDRT